MIEFPKEKVKAIITEIDRSLEKQETNAIAAFDADGTLWDTDIGEIFFHYQINNKLVADLPENPWEYYLNLKENISAEKAYLWLAQINAGIPIDQVRQWAQEALDKADSIPLFEAQKEIVGHLLSRDVEVFIVTASIQWAVEPAAKLYGIPFENVVGVKTAVKDGIVTKEQEGPITYRQGKVTGLLERSHDRKPFFCSGNTMGDMPLLESSADIRLVLSAADENNSNYQSELEALSIAKEKGWFSHRYRV